MSIILTLSCTEESIIFSWNSIHALLVINKTNRMHRTIQVECIECTWPRKEVVWGINR